CPTGIDIRNGLQMECIGCTACIDACDEIMTKVQKPKGLIRYSVLDGSKFTFKKPRSLAYLALIILSISGLIWGLAGQGSIEATVLRAQEAPYIITAEEGTTAITNHFKLHLYNSDSRLRKIKFAA